MTVALTEAMFFFGLDVLSRTRTFSCILQKSKSCSDYLGHSYWFEFHTFAGFVTFGVIKQQQVK